MVFTVSRLDCMVMRFSRGPAAQYTAIVIIANDAVCASKRS
jgi:hypothetical protein